jgi:hypothetical protein
VPVTISTTAETTAGCTLAKNTKKPSGPTHMSRKQRRRCSGDIEDEDEDEDEEEEEEEEEMELS